jgi:acyl-[acyl-carrier-protein] desaturase
VTGVIIRNFEIDPDKDRALFEELAEPTADLLNAHLENQINNDTLWRPYELVDFDRGRDFTKYPWRSDDYPLASGIRSSIYVNLLTEDNLPYYTLVIRSPIPKNHPLLAWSGQWTMEESRHSDVIRDFVLTTRAIDPAYLEAGRVVQMKKGEVPEPPSIAEMLAYTSFQEKSTQISHGNTSKALDKVHGGKKIFGYVAGDELRHYNFYSGLVAAGLEIDPLTMLNAIFNQMNRFNMPGTGIPDFEEHSRAIAEAGIYDLTKFHEEVVTPTLKKWEIYDLDGLVPEAGKTISAIDKYVKILGRTAAIQKDKIDEKIAAIALNGI